MILALPLVAMTEAGGADESIGVSGHWVLEVRDPDGRLVERREFHNALFPNNPLSQVMTSQRSAGPLEIALGCVGPTCTSPCPGTASAPSPFCRIVEPRQAIAASTAVFKNLTVASVAGGFQLKGFAIAGVDAPISIVTTSMTTCTPTTGSASCTVAGAGQGLQASLTNAILTTPVQVVAGQQVLVTVTLGFATAAAPQ